MDAIVSLASFVGLLSLFGVVAAILGSDTRDGFEDDPTGSPRFR